MVRKVLVSFLILLSFIPASAGTPLPADLRWGPTAVATASAADTNAASPIAGIREDSIVSVAVDPAMSTGALNTDSVAGQSEENRDWWYLFKKGKLKMDDPTVKWPKFLGFCVKVYNWGDRVFSSTNHDYVVGTGKNWRTRLINDNWTDSYYMRVSNDFQSLMSGKMHILVGASIQYMAVSYSYSLDVSHLITGGTINYKKQEFGFNCPRFSIDGYYYANDDGTFIRTFGKYKENGRKHVRIPFSGITMSTFGLDGYYFFNGYKYSQGAAYNYSRIQKLSQGCLLAGFSYCSQDISIDFNKLPEKLIPYYGLNNMKLRFHYNDYNIIVGYGYNCVMGKHWLYNITVMPGIGFNHCFEDSEYGSANLFSLGGRLMTSFTYNSGNIFAGLQGKIRGNWYHSNDISLFNAVETFNLSAGIRF